MQATSNLKKSNQAGFSLVELMIVVAIIGILASIAVPQYQKFIFKARQTEAKTGLAGIYTCEKAFYAEWSQYSTTFQVIGYTPEGKYFYNIGFGKEKQASNVTEPASGRHFNTLSACPTTAAAGCKSMQQAKALDAAATVAEDYSTFIAQAASSKLQADGSDDNWTMDNQRNLNNAPIANANENQDANQPANNNNNHAPQPNDG